MTPDLAAWVEWKERCALRLCSESTRLALETFAGQRFQELAARCAWRVRAVGDYAKGVSGSDAWHLFEVQLTVKNNRQGKRYKDWLFTRSDGPGNGGFEAIRGGASILMRDVVRQYLVEECPPAGTISISTPLDAEGGNAFTVEDLLPCEADPAGDVEKREYESLARKHAETCFGEMDFREKVATLAKALGVGLSHPSVARTARCRKSSVAASYRDFVVKFSRRLKSDYPDDDGRAVIMLTLMALEEVKAHVLAWGPSEKACADLYASVGVEVRK